jgi:hypothetical protein
MGWVKSQDRHDTDGQAGERARLPYIEPEYRGPDPARLLEVELPVARKKPEVPLHELPSSPGAAESKSYEMLLELRQVLSHCFDGAHLHLSKMLKSTLVNPWLSLGRTVRYRPFVGSSSRPQSD